MKMHTFLKVGVLVGISTKTYIKLEVRWKVVTFDGNLHKAHYQNQSLYMIIRSTSARTAVHSLPGRSTRFVIDPYSQHKYSKISIEILFILLSVMSPYANILMMFKLTVAKHNHWNALPSPSTHQCSLDKFTLMAAHILVELLN